MRGEPSKIAKFQLLAAGLEWPTQAGLGIRYEVVGRSPGHVFGEFDPEKPMILWLHGGAFIMPAAPNAHLYTAAKICAELGANAFMPDYRLAPANPFPASLNDVEQAYLDLLERGIKPKNIVLIGDSAGGNLIFGLLQRLKKRKLDMPCCAIPISPVTDLSRVHGLPSRSQRRKSDPLLAITSFSNLAMDYLADNDTSNPEISPLFMDCKGLPPMQFFVSDNEVLRDDRLYMAQRCHAAGVDTECHLWPKLPHAFPLFGKTFKEACGSHSDIVRFAEKHLQG